MSNPNTERQAFGLTILKNTHKDIRRLRKDTGNATLHGNKFWKSTYVLMDYLQECPPDRDIKILEIGCGWGLGGIYCAKHFNAHVTSLDADPSVFPFLRHHAELNGVHVTTWQKRFEKITKQELAEFDLIIGADICFWDELTPIVRNLIKRALQAGVPRVVLTDPGRPTFREVGEYFCERYDAVYSDWDVPSPHNVWGLILDIYNP
ncbi:MAG: hypothetical protein AseanaTS_01760 [Candidatus Pelagadaptatus aseana]|uniref:class I SAM-dependent methyltransferase n=1 Tax=Candidatus Pelagadaptatus aseana TaxID=3120508 RepID=UPI0039B270B4